MASLIIDSPQTTETVQLKNASPSRGVYAYFYKNKTYLLTNSFEKGFTSFYFICLDDPMKTPVQTGYGFSDSVKTAMSAGHNVFLFNDFNELAQQIAEPAF